MKSTLESVKLNKEVVVSKIGCSRKYKEKNFRFRYYRRDKNKASIKKSVR